MEISDFLVTTRLSVLLVQTLHTWLQLAVFVLLNPFSLVTLSTMTPEASRNNPKLDISTLGNNGILADNKGRGGCAAASGSPDFLSGFGTLEQIPFRLRYTPFDHPAGVHPLGRISQSTRSVPSQRSNYLSSTRAGHLNIPGDTYAVVGCH